MNNLLKLRDYGQSYWMDNLTRGMIVRGELKKRVTEQGLLGITSNPTIFNKAISKSSDYDEQIRQLVEEKRGVREIYEALVVKDIQDACDILRPVYDQSDGIDGFVSLEVSPYLAYDTQGTIQEVNRLFQAVSRPNCFIKIPGTSAAVPAIEECLYRGVNVNITLLFSIQNYEAVAHTYIRALERRVAEGKPIRQLASVASFFLSRIDTLADQLLGHRIVPGAEVDDTPPVQLLGKAAVASAKLAYVSFKRIFNGDRWQKLADQGARVQRPLWASTSTKDPLYRDVKYVEPLIGPHTVNTMPEPTISAFADHGIIEANSIEKDVEEARQVVNDLGKAGIDLDFVTRQLVNEGIQKFIEPYNTLMSALAGRRRQLLADKESPQIVSFGPSKAEVAAAYESLDAKQFARRLYARDALLWKSDPKQVAAIRNRLGWLDSMKDFLVKADDLTSFAREIRDAQFQHVVLLGMGGSSLCPEVARETFGSAPGWPKLLVLDNTDPAAIADVESQIDLKHTLFLVASKSGTTTETISFYRYFYGRMSGKGIDKAGSHFVAITDPGTRLAEEGRGRGFRRIFENPADVGGRYSAVSYFGLLPMALIGVDIRLLLDQALQMRQSCGPSVPPEANPGVSLGALLGINERNGRDKVTFVLSRSVSRFGAWAEQLLAESTGKDGRGLIPIDGEELGKPEDYGQDRTFIFMRLKDETDQKTERKLQTLEAAGHPLVRIELRDRLALGAEFMRWEVATAAAGAVLGIDPFDEPNVAESKKNTTDLLQEWKQKGTFAEGSPIIGDDRLNVYCAGGARWLFEGSRNSMANFVNAFLGLARSPDYVALLAYFLSTSGRDKRLDALRLHVRNRARVATTLGYGPRYLHSTGQLHKGGPDRGVFVLLTADASEDLLIPGEDFGFAVLQRAQALGDFRSLNSKGRRVIRIHLGPDVDKGLKLLVDMVNERGGA
ncbi:MAG: bifunctional transaldolase/phosoglucose isomerase [Acidobacteriia bacterium]|nr:bifunctional transaldolase/phosoglucose isomerase [Terriglobia bacterium]